MKYRPPPDGNWGTVHPLGCRLRRQGHPPASGSRQARPTALEQNLGRRRGIRRRQCGHQAPPPASPPDATAGRHVFLVISSRARAECSVSRASHAGHCPVRKPQSKDRLQVLQCLALAAPDRVVATHGAGARSPLPRRGRRTKPRRGLGGGIGWRGLGDTRARGFPRRASRCKVDAVTSVDAGRRRRALGTHGGHWTVNVHPGRYFMYRPGSTQSGPPDPIPAARIPRPSQRRSPRPHLSDPTPPQTTCT